MNDISSSPLRKMNAIEEAARLIRGIAEPCPPGDSVKAAISRASRRIGWSFSRTRAIWYADARIRLAAEELDDLRSKARASQAEKERDLYHALLQRIARLESAVAFDPTGLSDAGPFESHPFDQSRR